MNHNKFTNEYYLMPREAAFLGLPIGNAFSGVPFKQKEMPFGALFAAVGTAAAAVGTAAGVGATMAAVGTLAVATVTAVGAVAAVAGIGMSIVGMATGNKSLKKLGMMVGLAGGLAFMGGSAIASMGIAGGGFSMGTTALEAANGSIAAGQATAVAASEAASGLLTAAPVDIMANTATDAAQMAELSAHSTGLSGITGSVAPQISTGAGNVAINGLVDGAKTAAQPLISPLNAGATQVVDGALAPAAKGSSGFFSFLDGMSGTDKASTLLMGGSILKGMGSSSTDELARDEFNYKKQQQATLNDIPTMTPYKFSTVQENAAKAKAGMLA